MHHFGRTSGTHFAVETRVEGDTDQEGNRWVTAAHLQCASSQSRTEELVKPTGSASLAAGSAKRPLVAAAAAAVQLLWSWACFPGYAMQQSGI